jgi:hypothetical protein
MCLGTKLKASAEGHNSDLRPDDGILQLETPFSCARAAPRFLLAFLLGLEIGGTQTAIKGS